MHPFIAVAAAAAFVPAGAAGAQAGISPPAATAPTHGTPIGPPAPAGEADPESAVPRDGPLPASLTLRTALDEAEARSPAILAARARVEASQARIRQAGYRLNPELSVEVENFLGTGDLSGLRQTEATVTVSQRLDLGGRRRTRVAAAQAELVAEHLRLAIARADLAQSVRLQFARTATARDRLRIAEENEFNAREIARVATILVEEGRDPPLRGVRARSAAAQAAAELEAARADEIAARGTLAGLFGVAEPPQAVTGGLLDLEPTRVDPEQSLEVRLAETERLRAEAEVGSQVAQGRVDPAVGLGVRHVRETGDFALVGGVTLPLQVFDRNQGNVEAARADVRAAEASLAGALASARVRTQNAIVAVEAAEARVRALESAGVPEAAEAMRLAQLSYQEGRASLLELLDAQNAYRTAQLALVDARLALATATAELGRAAAR